MLASYSDIVMVNNMNIKKYLILLPVIIAFASVFNLAQTTSVSALKCPNGQVLHADNLCWKESTPSASGCTSEQGVFSRNNNKCNLYAGVPTRDDGKKVLRTDNVVECPTGYEYHSSDGKCWKPVYGAVVGKTEATCKGHGTGTDEARARDYTGEMHWDNGTCWVKHDYEDSKNPISVKTPTYCQSQYSGASVAACERGANNQSCAGLSDQRTTRNGVVGESARDICQGGQAARLCNVHKKDGDMHAITNAQANCVQSADKCLKDNNTTSAQQECLSKVRGVNQETAETLGQGGNNGGPSAGYGAGNTGNCGKARTNLVHCDGEGVSAIGDVLKTILIILTVIVGIVAVGGIAYAAVLYASAEDNASQVSKAKTILRDVAIGIVLYGLMVAITNWLVPGGVIT